MPSYMFLLYACAIRLQLKLFYFNKTSGAWINGKTIGENNRKLLLYFTEHQWYTKM